VVDDHQGRRQGSQEVQLSPVEWPRQAMRCFIQHRELLRDNERKGIARTHLIVTRLASISPAPHR
jgi:hypothetical protein